MTPIPEAPLRRGASSKTQAGSLWYFVSRKLARVLLGVTLVPAVGCGDPVSVVDEPFLGQYHLATLRSAFFGDTVDHVAAGARFDLELLPTGEAMLGVIVPAGARDGSDLIQNGTSTWIASRIPVVFDSLFTNVTIRPIPGDEFSFVYAAILRYHGDSLSTFTSHCGFTTFDFDVQECRIDIALKR